MTFLMLTDNASLIAICLTKWHDQKHNILLLLH